MMTQDQVRYSLRQARRWRDLLWASILEDMDRRIPEASRAARAAIHTDSIRQVTGDSTRQATTAWPHMDAQARADWVWVCKFVHRTWIRGARAAYSYAGDEGVE